MLDLTKAQAFVDSYGRASAANDPEALAAHYAEPYRAFSLGYSGGFETRAAALAQMVPWMKRFDEYGLNDIRFVGTELHPVSDTFCLCHITIEVHPKDGKPPFRFMNVYGLRQDAQGQRFEFSIADNENAALTERYPDFMRG